MLYCFYLLWGGFTILKRNKFSIILILIARFTIGASYRLVC
jgi:hypothetical protein